MRSFVTYTLLASATFASASIDPRFEYPDTVPSIEKRQEPGTPRYQCHEDCGLLITLGRTDGYCSSTEWNERFDRCMICANTFDIWQYYGNAVGGLATACGLTASPSPSGSTAEPTTTTAPPAEETSTSSPPEVTTEPPTEEPVTTSSSGPVDSTTADAPASTEAPVDSSAPTTLSTAVSTVPDGTATPPSTTTAADSAASSSGGSLGTVGVTPKPTPSTIVVSGAVRQLGLTAGLFISVFAMLVVY